MCADEIELLDCNCSICAKTAYLHLIVDSARFRLVAGSEQLTTYTFNSGAAKHLFCSVCGIKSFYLPRSHPGAVSVNYRCLDRPDFRSVRITPFDGRNWERAAEALG